MCLVSRRGIDGKIIPRLSERPVVESRNRDDWDDESVICRLGKLE